MLHIDYRYNPKPNLIYIEIIINIFYYIPQLFIRLIFFLKI